MLRIKVAEFFTVSLVSLGECGLRDFLCFVGCGYLCGEFINLALQFCESGLRCCGFLLGISHLLLGLLHVGFEIVKKRGVHIRALFRNGNLASLQSASVANKRIILHIDICVCVGSVKRYTGLGGLLGKQTHDYLINR